MGLITRSAMRSFMECDGNLEEIGEGFTEFTENKNPKEYARQYINEAAERTDLVGFASGVTYAFDVYENNPVHQKLLAMTLNEAIGPEAVVTVVTAFLYLAGSTETRVKAVRRSYAVCPSRLGGGTDALICAGTLKACGEITEGELDTVSMTFHTA